MKTKTFINKFWKNLFGSKEMQNETSEEEKVSEQNSQNFIEAKSINLSSDNNAQQFHSIISEIEKKPFKQSVGPNFKENEISEPPRPQGGAS